MNVVIEKDTYKVVVDGNNAILLPKTQLEFDAFKELIAQSNRFVGKASGVITLTPAVMYLNNVMISNLQAIKNFCEPLSSSSVISISHSFRVLASVAKTGISRSESLGLIGENIISLVQSVRYLGNAMKLPVANVFDLNVQFQLPNTTEALSKLLNDPFEKRAQTQDVMLALGAVGLFLLLRGK